MPYAPGGSTDVVFRILAPRMSEILGQQILIDNRPGASSTIGLDIVAKSPPDGYTVGISNIAYGANPSIYKKMPFDSEKDLVPVSLVSIVTLVVTLHPSDTGALGQGIDRAREVEAGVADVWLGGQRQREPPRHRALRAHGEYQARARSL